MTAARAFAYGGSVIQDLGYFPFGSKRFTNLVHYVRSGDFVEALIREARSPEELAFALGGLAHYACDNVGHPVATNRVVPMMYPKLRAEVGERALYADSPARHIMVEFAFDVLHVAGGGYAAQAYRDRIGFEVAKPVLERAFRTTYDLELKDLFGDEDLAIGTYRHAIGTLIPEMTRLAWEDKQDEIRARTPDVVRDSFVFALTRQEYRHGVRHTVQKTGVVDACSLLLHENHSEGRALSPTRVRAAHSRGPTAVRAELRRRTRAIQGVGAGAAHRADFAGEQRSRYRRAVKRECKPTRRRDQRRSRRAAQKKVARWQLPKHSGD